MKRLALTLALVAAVTPVHADGTSEPRPEPIQRTTMGGSFPVEMVVVAIFVGIIAGAVNGSSSR